MEGDENKRYPNEGRNDNDNEEGMYMPVRSLQQNPSCSAVDIATTIPTLGGKKNRK